MPSGPRAYRVPAVRRAAGACPGVGDPEHSGVINARDLGDRAGGNRGVRRAEIRGAESGGEWLAEAG